MRLDRRGVRITGWVAIPLDADLFVPLCERSPVTVFDLPADARNNAVDTNPGVRTLSMIEVQYFERDIIQEYNTYSVTKKAAGKFRGQCFTLVIREE